MAISTGAAILGSAVGSALLGSRSASKAAGASKAASDAAIAEQRRQFDLNMQRSQPFYEGSLNAYNALLEMEGLGGGAAPSIANMQPNSVMPSYKMEQLQELRGGGLMRQGLNEQDPRRRMLNNPQASQSSFASRPTITNRPSISDIMTEIPGIGARYGRF